MVFNEDVPYTQYSYLANVKVGKLERKCKLADIWFGKQDDTDVDCLTNTHIIISIDVH